MTEPAVSPPPEDLASATRAHECVTKPWGHEEIFALVEGAYVGKTLHVNAGEALSLQFHRAKDETIAVLSGEAQLDLGTEADHLTTVDLAPGMSVHVPPGLLHRLRAVTDAVLVEASTAAPGWREDVVRLEDRYGRGGTNAP
ncbi:MAG: cupin domain-containing protein [Actinomycetes bacterium]